MTGPTRQYLESVGKLALFLVPIGIAWGVLTAEVTSLEQRKVDRVVYVADSVSTHEQLNAILRLLDETNSELQLTNTRLRELICADKTLVCR